MLMIKHRKVPWRLRGDCQRSLKSARGLFVGFLLLLFFAPTLRAQTSGSATLRVTVKDPNGAVVPKATVILTSDRTGEQRRAETSGEGTTTFASLDPGTYTLRIEATNFKAAQQSTEGAPQPERYARRGRAT
jgi:hypothetical protein